MLFIIFRTGCLYLAKAFALRCNYQGKTKPHATRCAIEHSSDVNAEFEMISCHP